MAKRLYVGNLSYSTTQGQIEEIFSKFGQIATVNLIIDKFSGNSKGFAFVEMSSDEEAEKAIAGLNESDLDGRKIVVNEARPQEKRDSFGGGGGGGGQRGGYQGNNDNRNNKRW